MSKFKIAKPEDFLKNIEGYQFKLARAYSVTSSNFLEVLMDIDTLSDMIGIEYKENGEIADRLQEIIQDYKITKT